MFRGPRLKRQGLRVTAGAKHVPVARLGFGNVFHSNCWRTAVTSGLAESLTKLTAARVGLQDMPRPFAKLKALDIDELSEAIAAGGAAEA